MTTYTAICERDDDWWVITVPELDAGAVTQAHTLDEVPGTVADLVALMSDADPTSVEIDMKVRATPGTDPGKVARLALAAVTAAAAARRAIHAAARASVR